ncbi:TetR family transcriptional regulator [Actinomadura sp. J1-007]|uniref:TetR/AcrR family transcriptional regulator n=1 Tax=Actinomadura sp. J1-007 TaxID=2661913 RepID=UPI001327E9E6|nr:helix-turn-helix domain-containing protein [Actinomadura sp. J1-007]MWK38860.1 TetR family transcriptional regulator [Actinomadura sp. J1-007]
MTEQTNDRARRPRLAEVYEPGRPGLPRGRSSLPRTAVRDAQRARLMRAAIAAVAEKGYASTTVADVVGRARVSRKAFYEHFPDLERCFLASLAGAQRTILRRLASVPRTGAATSRAPGGRCVRARGRTWSCARRSRSSPAASWSSCPPSAPAR